MIFKKLSFAIFLNVFTLLMIIGCKESSPTKKEVSNADLQKTDTIIPSKKIIQKKIAPEKQEPILPFTAPKNLEELLNTIYVVDTLIQKKILNGVGDDDNEYELSFNEIIGVVNSQNNDYPILFAMKPIYNINTVYQQKDSSFLIPFYTDRDREICLLTKWKKEAGNINFVAVMKNLIRCKYAILKVSDEVEVNGVNYLIGEEFQSDEAGQFHSVWVAKLLDEISMKRLAEHHLGIVDSDTIRKPLNLVLKNQKIFLETKGIEQLILNPN